MIQHPLLIAVVVGDLLSLLLWLGAVRPAFRIVVNRVAQSAKQDTNQPKRVEKAARFSAKFSFVVFFISTVLLVIGIANVFPASIAGSMCGAGVLQATDGLGDRALLYRFFLFFIMTLWLTLTKLDFRQPDAPLKMYNYRLMLLALPFYILAVITTIRSILRIDFRHPVDCCMLAYDKIGNLAAASQFDGRPDAFWVWTFWPLTALMILCAVWSFRSQQTNGTKATGSLALITIIWVPIAAITLVRVYAVNFNQVLFHHCPWCLFLPEHTYVGIPLFGALIIIFLEGSISYLVAKTAANFPDLLPSAKRHSKLAALKLLLATVAYTGMVALPILYPNMAAFGFA